MKRSRLTRNRTQGFTMVELMVAIAVIAILAAFAVPGVINYLPEYRLKKAAKDLYGNLQLARMTAVRNNAECEIAFNIATNRYFICTGAGVDGVWNGPPEMGGDDITLKSNDLGGYGDNIGFGPGSAGGVPDPITFASNGTNDIAIFTERGLLIQPNGIVYIQNNQQSAWRARVLVSGAMNLEKWHAPSNNWE